MNKVQILHMSLIMDVYEIMNVNNYLQYIDLLLLSQISIFISLLCNQLSV